MRNRNRWQNATDKIKHFQVGFKGVETPFPVKNEKLYLELDFLT